LVTGAPYAASAAALTPVRAYRLDQAGFAAAIEQRAALSQELEAMAHRGQTALSSDAVASEDHQREQPDLLMSRVRHFLEKLAKAPAL
jgi:CRP-like cAMP-binding protein